MHNFTIPNVKPRSKDPANWRPMQSARQIRVPIWRRMVSMAVLVGINVVVGIAIAAILGGTALLTLVMIERAVGQPSVSAARVSAAQVNAAQVNAAQVNAAGMDPSRLSGFERGTVGAGGPAPTIRRRN